MHHFSGFFHRHYQINFYCFSVRYPPRLFWGIFNHKIIAHFSKYGYQTFTVSISCVYKPKKLKWLSYCGLPAVSVS